MITFAYCENDLLLQLGIFFKLMISYFLLSMINKNIKYISRVALFSGLFILQNTTAINAQQNLSVKEWQSHFQHGIEQYQNDHFELAIKELEKFIDERKTSLNIHGDMSQDAQLEEAQFYLLLAKVRLDNNERYNAVGFFSKDDEVVTASRSARDANDWLKEAEDFIANTKNPYYQQRLSYYLANNYFYRNDLPKAKTYFELAGLDNLTNEEIVDAKFGLAYCYFNEQEFTKAKSLFKAIKDMPSHKYYIPGNYYYALLAYNDQNYSEALESFNKIEDHQLYSFVVPYHKAEIYYFQNQPQRVLNISEKYLKTKGIHYKKEMHLLTAQVYFEDEKYAEAIPHFEEYYNATDYIKKEELYEYAYSYYQLENWDKAIEMFQQLSNTEDALGQTAMYLLGDCYLKQDDKKGARNAYAVCMDMDYNAGQKEAAMFLFSKLSMELGDERLAMNKLEEFVQNYPQSEFNSEAKRLLAHSLTKNNDYKEAFRIISGQTPTDYQTWTTYQQVTVGRAMQLLQQRDYSQADELLSLSLQQPNDAEYEAIAYFWKSEIAYSQQRHESAIQYGKQFLTLAKGNERSLSQLMPEVTINNAEYNIGHAQLALNNYVAAEKAFASAKKQTNSGVTTSPSVQAEANIREADALFMQQKYAAAAKLYDLAIKQEVANIDYARYQRAMIHGIQNDDLAKRNILNDLAKKNFSDYQMPATLELANMSLEARSWEEAIGLYSKVNTSNKSSKEMKEQALLGLGAAYKNQGQLENAKTTYITYLLEYPNAKEKEFALTVLEDIYYEEGKPQEYLDFLMENEIKEVASSDRENAYYDVGIRAFAGANFSEAEKAFTKYLGEYPEGTHAEKAYFYRGEANYSLGNNDEALEDFAKVLSYDWGDFSEESAIKGARLAWTLKDYEKVNDYNHLLNKHSLRSEVKDQSLVGIARSAYELSSFDEAYNYADKAMLAEEMPGNLLEEAALIKALVLVDRGENESAMTLFQELKSSKIAAIYAPANYHIAYITFMEGNLAKAEELAAYSAQNGGGQEYWIVNSYLLLSEVLFEAEYYFDAKALLKNIVDDPTQNEKVAPLKMEAQFLLDRILEIEKSKSKVK